MYGISIRVLCLFVVILHLFVVVSCLNFRRYSLRLKWLLTCLDGKSQSSVKSRDVPIVFCLVLFTPGLNFISLKATLSNYSTLKQQFSTSFWWYTDSQGTSCPKRRFLHDVPWVERLRSASEKCVTLCGRYVQKPPAAGLQLAVRRG